MHYPDLPLHNATVLSCDADTAHVSRLRVRLADSLPFDAFTTPGQYVALAPEREPARWFVIASLPSALPVLDFLIGRGSATSDELCALGPGDAVRISAPQGEGFPMDRLQDRDVVAFTSGTGVAAVAPVVEALLASGSGGRVQVFQQERVRGEVADARSPCAFPLRDVLDRWAAAGVRVVRACDATPHGAADFVDASWAAAPGPAPTECEYLICGNEQLEARVAAALERGGVARDRIHRNY